MSVWRPVDTRIWGDRKFRSLTPLQPCGQAAWLYLLTTSATTAFPGLLNLGGMQMAEDLKWPELQVERCLGELVIAGMVRRDKESRVIWLPRALAYNPPQSPNVVRGWGKRLAIFPESDLVVEAVKALGEDLHRMFAGQAGEVSFRAAYESWASSYLETSATRTSESAGLEAFTEGSLEGLPEASAEALPESRSRPGSKPKPRPGKARTDLPPTAAQDAAVERVFCYWKELWLVRDPQLSPARKRCIQRAIADFGLDGVLRALAGYRTDSWVERHDSLSRHDLTLLLRDPNHVERGLDLASRCSDVKLAPWLPLEIRLRHPGTFEQAWQSGLVDLGFDLSPAEAGVLRNDIAGGRIDRFKWRRLFEQVVAGTLAEPPNVEVVVSARQAIRGAAERELPEDFQFSEAACRAVAELRGEVARG